MTLSERLLGIVPSVVYTQGFGVDFALNEQQRADLEAAAKICKAAEDAVNAKQYNCDCLNAAPDGSVSGDGVTTDEGVYCQRWVVLVDDLKALDAAVLAGGTPR